MNKNHVRYGEISTFFEEKLLFKCDKVVCVVCVLTPLKVVWIDLLEELVVSLSEPVLDGRDSFVSMVDAVVDGIFVVFVEVVIEDIVVLTGKDIKAINSIAFETSRKKGEYFLNDYVLQAKLKLI